ncbi:MAG: restriction endonuclease [Bowdeniella nasicola]|nr:restriction endonuclease [Bowdeniella nasicola]
MPTKDEFRPIILRVLADGQPRSRQEIYRVVADEAGLSPAARSERIASGGLSYQKRIGWACGDLYRAGLLHRPQRAIYQITDDGRTVAARDLKIYTERDQEEWPKWQAYQAELAARRKKRKDETNEKTTVGTGENPLEQLVENVEQFNTETATELRQILQESSPEFFENAVIDLLWKMGYGGTHGEKQHVGKSHDGGIDGVIRQDALGLQNVYVQAKRYADTNSVGRQAIQQFYGALASRGADRGVFITTSTFTEHAKSEARSYRGKIVLIDGIRLTSLMLNYGVGVQRFREFTLYQVDDDYFESDLG